MSGAAGGREVLRDRGDVAERNGWQSAEIPGQPLYVIRERFQDSAAGPRVYRARPVDDDASDGTYLR